MVEVRLEEKNPSSLFIWLGGIELRTDIKGLRVPSLGIDIEGDLPPTLARRVVESVLRGERDTVEIRALAEASRLPPEYYRYIFDRLQRNPATVFESIRCFQQFEERGYLYSSSSQQLLVKGQSCPAFFVEFRGPRQATCSCVNPDYLAEAVISLSSGRADPYTHLAFPKVSPSQASIVERAVSELHLPYADVARIIQLISTYEQQEPLFAQLSDGAFLDEGELLRLERNAKHRKAEQRRMERYRKLAEMEFVFLPDRKELVVPPLHIVIRLRTKKAAMYQILHQEPLETGRYIATGNALLAPLQTKDMKDNDLKTLLDIWKKAASELQEPYRSRLLEFLVYLRLS
jgi:hypothetical protein